MGIEISGLGELQRDLENAKRALQSLDGDLARVNVDPDDPASIDAAIREVEAIIDEKVRPYRGSQVVDEITANLKERAREYIRRRARGEE